MVEIMTKEETQTAITKLETMINAVATNDVAQDNKIVILETSLKTYSDQVTSLDAIIKSLYVKVDSLQTLDLTPEEKTLVATLIALIKTKLEIP